MGTSYGEGPGYSEEGGGGGGEGMVRTERGYGQEGGKVWSGLGNNLQLIHSRAPEREKTSHITVPLSKTSHDIT